MKESVSHRRLSLGMLLLAMLVSFVILPGLSQAAIIDDVEPSSPPEARRMITRTITASIALAGDFPPYPVPQDRGELTDLLDEGQIEGANYRIRIPDGWDTETLLLYAHGYRAKDSGNTTPEAAPGGVAMEDALLAEGYAIAGSAFRDNGWAVLEGISDTLALTHYFNDTYGRAERTILVGASMGSLVALKSIEDWPDTYDAALGLCPVGAGASLTWDSALDLALAYDVTFGWPESWGTVWDVRDDLNYETEVLTRILRQLNADRNYGRFEFIRLLLGLPADNFYQGTPELPPWPLIQMFYATEARAELEGRAGSPVVQNQDHIYFLSQTDRAYLAGLGVDADALLAQMNARREDNKSAATQAYLAAAADLSGQFSGPVLTLHTTEDGLVPAFHETVYRQTVSAAGQDDRLVQLFTDAVGHCTFSQAQGLSVVQALDDWLAGGPKPSPTDFVMTAGFTETYVSPDWPIAFSIGDWYLPLVKQTQP